MRAISAVAELHVAVLEQQLKYDSETESGFVILALMVNIALLLCRYWPVDVIADVQCHYSAAVQQASELSNWFLSNWLEYGQLYRSAAHRAVV